MLRIFATLYQLLVIYNIICHTSSTESINNVDEHLRIVGGRLTSIERYPYMVMILYEYNSELRCGGSNLQSQWVLTAAHCLHPRIVGDNVAFMVKAGSSTVSYSPTEQLSYADFFIHHPGYDLSTHEHDIGLIKLTRPFVINEYVAYTLIPYNFYYNLFSTPSVGVAVGWGATTFDPDYADMSNRLKAVEVQLIRRLDCMRYPEVWIPEDQFCAGAFAYHHGTCQGDSGGALIFRGIQIGILIGGRVCAEPYSPGRYTAVELYLGWIDYIISNA